MDRELTPTLISPEWDDYELIDCGEREKLERFGSTIVARPEPQALWKKSLSDKEWRERADAYFKREGSSEERGTWMLKPKVAESWNINYNYREMSLSLRLAMTSFKHVGLFPEQAANWNYIYDKVRAKGECKVLNLFAYTGGATLAARAAGASVTHVDSVKQVVTWSRGNMEASGLDQVRWIVEDARKFVAKEVRRGNSYYGIILDPPAYGRGADGEKWVLEQDIYPMLEMCREIVEDGGFLLLNLYSMGLSAMLARGILVSIFGQKSISFGELYVTDNYGKNLPLGVYARIEL